MSVAVINGRLNAGLYREFTPSTPRPVLAHLRRVACAGETTLLNEWIRGRDAVAAAYS